MNIIQPRAGLAADRRSIYAFWALCVALNASLPFVFSLAITNSVPQALGVATAVLSFIWLYSELDYRLLSKQAFDWSKQLRLSATLKVITFIAPAIELMTGIIAISVVDYLIKSISWMSINVEDFDLFQAQSETGFWVSYLITMINGLLLSLFVGLILLIVRGLIKALSNRQA